MTYLPTQEDLALLTNRSKDISCKIDLLDKDYAIIDSIEGLALDGSESIDADSDARRTFNLSIHPKKNSVIDDYQLEDWVNKMVRIYTGLRSPVSLPFSSLDAEDEDIDAKICASDAYIEAQDRYNQIVKRIKMLGLERYGNIENIPRPRIWWTKANMEKYKDFVDENPDIEEGDYSTVFTADDTPSYTLSNGVTKSFQLAYTPLLQQGEELVPLVLSVINDYFFKLIRICYETTGDVTATGLLRLDAIGMEEEVYGEKIQVCKLIVAVEGEVIAGRTLEPVDVSAIAGWPEDELLKFYKKTSWFVDKSAHELHAQLYDARDGIDETYQYMWAQLTGSSMDDRSLSSVTGISSSYVDTSGIHWFSQGVYAIKDNSVTYDATTNTLSLSCTDLTALLDGTLGGNLTGYATKIYKYERKLDDDGYPVEDTSKPVPIRDAIVQTFKLSSLSKSMIDYWKRYVPHDLEYSTGTTIWDILTELRDMYFPMEMYFEDDTFVCKEIPSGMDDPVVLDPDLFASLIISENASVDYSQIYNCAEVWGATIESDYFCKETVSEDDPDGTCYISYVPKTDRVAWNEVIDLMTNNKLDTTDSGDRFLYLKLKNVQLSAGTNISFVCPADFSREDLKTTRVVIEDTIIVKNTSSDNETVETTYHQVYGPLKLYAATTDKNGNDVLLAESSSTTDTASAKAESVLKKDKYYVFTYNEQIINQGTTEEPNVVKESRMYFQGQSQSHAMVKFVDVMPSNAQIEADKITENCDNLKYIVVNDPTDLTGLYESRFTIDKIGRRNKIFSGGDYDNYTTDESAMEVAEYLLWQGCRLTDSLTLSMILIPWLDVNQKVKYAPKYMKTMVPVEWIIKKIDTNLGEGTMNITLSRYYPYYPYIVSNKYDE